MKTSHGLAIDGFVRTSATGGSSPKKITEASNLLNPKQAGTRLKSAAQGVHSRAAQRSQTLMRGAVKKPSLNKARSGLQPAVGGKVAARSSNLDPTRVSRVQSITKSTKVRRFGHVYPPAKSAKIQPKQEVITKTPQPTKALVAKPNAQNAIYKPLPSMLTSASNRQLERMLDEALTRADAHKKSRRGRFNSSFLQKFKIAPRWLTITVGVFAIAVVGGYLAMRQIPQVAMRVAATKAHVDAKVPAYTPSGFKLATPIQASPGSVSVKYQANDNAQRSFTLTQQPSNMDSKSLSASVVPQNTQVQTSTVDGTTVYIYGNNNNAAWVDHGMQYKIKDAANLNSDQLLKIANSL